MRNHHVGHFNAVLLPCLAIFDLALVWCSFYKTGQMHYFWFLVTDTWHTFTPAVRAGTRESAVTLQQPGTSRATFCLASMLWHPIDSPPPPPTQTHHPVFLLVPAQIHSKKLCLHQWRQ